MSLINRAKVKRIALEIAAVERSHKFTRVSKDFLDNVEAELKNVIRSKIKALPSKGKTI